MTGRQFISMADVHLVVGSFSLWKHEAGECRLWSHRLAGPPSEIDTDYTCSATFLSPSMVLSTGNDGFVSTFEQRL